MLYEVITSGIALIIFSTQIKDAFGLQTGQVPADFIGKWETYFHSFSSINYVAIIITVVTILISLFFNKITNKIPGSFVAIIFVTAAVAIFKLPVTTIETLFGEISGKITMEFPAIDWSNISYNFV